MIMPSRTAFTVGVRSGFTMIEMLVVLLIMLALFGIAIAIPLGEEREGQVRGAAEELAAVLRETRTRAIRENRSFAVAFNIENAPGSSGKILNNRSGGHWYRVLGPSDPTLHTYVLAGDDSLWSIPPLFTMSHSFLNGAWCDTSTKINPLSHYLRRVSRSWVDEPHRLAKGKVRFIALTDQDNGDNAMPNPLTFGPAGYYTATYPRPWFGWWDSTTKELRTWGGYDPSIKMVSQNIYPNWGEVNHNRIIVNGRDASHTGFYYEGYDGEITGCVNPTDRQVIDDANNDGLVTTGAAGFPEEVLPTPTKLYTVLKKDEPRPLINANWLDFVIVFRPNGTVCTDWFRLRQAYTEMKGFVRGSNTDDPYVITTFPEHGVADAGIADMCNGSAGAMNFGPHTPYYQESPYQREATDFVYRTGFYWITLAADAKDDRSTFPTAEAALHSMNPIYRVGISPDGEVKVLRVHNKNYQSRTFDSTLTGLDWEDKTKIWGKAAWTFSKPTAPNYFNHQLYNTDGTPRGMPIFDVVMPEMLRDRKWWWEIP